MERKSFLRNKFVGNLIITAVISLLIAQPVHSLPEGEEVVSGQAKFEQPSDTTLNITTSDRVTINYDSFSIAQREAVNFYQPSSSSIALNRVVGVDPSSIFGTLTANGRIFLINPNGVLFGPNSRVDVAALVASTLDISNADFLAGVYNFNKVDSKAGASIVNQGYIKAGSVSLAGQAVANSGVIEATLGSVALAAGDALTLNLDSAGMISVVIAEPVKEQVTGVSSAVENSGKITADGGKVILAAKTLNNIFDYAVNNSGIIQAKSLATKNGEIILDGGNSGIVANSGTLDASGKDMGGTGGTVKVLGEYVGLFDNSVIDVSGDISGGTVLIGGNFQGKGPEANAIRTYVGQDTIINADAITNGDAGKIIIWSDDVTRFYGNISAQGGIEGGNGGFAEISGKENLTYRGLVNLSSLNDNVGTLLLDPATITIKGGTGDGDDKKSTLKLDNSTGSGTGSVLFSDTPASGANGDGAEPFAVYESELENTSANILLQATDGINTLDSFGSQNVLLLSNCNLTLQTRNSSISGDGSTGINLTGSSDGTSLEFKTQGTGTITIQTGTGSSPSAAPITVGKLTTANQSITISSSGTLSAGTLNAGINTLNLTAGGAITQTGTITAGTLAVTNTSGTTTLNTQANTITNLGTINAAGQTFSIRNTVALGQSGVITAGTFAATLDTGALNLGTQTNAISNLGAITAPGGFTLTDGSAALTLTAGISTTNNPISISAGSITQNSGTSAVSGSGSISLSASGDIKLTLLDAGTTGDVSVTSTSGSILDNDLGTVAGGDYDIKGRNITLNVGGSGTIGKSGTGEEIDLQRSGTITDNVAPTISLLSRTAANGNGWNNTNVTVTFSATDPNWYTGAGINTGTSTLTVTKTSEGKNQTATGTAYDNAGNSVSLVESGINIDKTPPDITLNRSVAANVNGWNNEDVTISYTIDAGISGVATQDVVEGTYNSDGTYDTYAKVTDLADNYSEVLETVNIDKTPPDITLNRSVAANVNGWNNEDVTISYTIDAGISGVATQDVVEGTYNSDGTYDTYAKVTDLADNYSEVLETVNIDKTPPDITLNRSVAAHSNGWNEVPVTISYTIDAGISGVATQDVVEGTYNSDGTYDTYAKVTDLADNYSEVLETVNIKLHGTGTFTWNGSTDNSWGEWENWDTNVAPSDIDQVVVSGGTNNPILAADTGAKGLTINTDGSLDVAGHKLTITDSFSNSGEVTTSSGDIEIIAASITNGKITNPGGDVKLTANSGSILDDNDNSTKITANNLTLKAAGAIGASGTNAEIDISVNSLSAEADNGDIYLTNDKGLIVDSATATNGSISLETNGNTTLTNLSATGDGTNDITVTTNSDDTYNIYVGTLSAKDTITLTANSGSIIGLDVDGVNIDSPNLYLYTHNSIYGNNWLDTYFDDANNFLTTNATYINVEDVDTSKSVDIYDTSSVRLDIDAGSVDSVCIVAEGGIEVDYVYNPHSVTLEARGGSIYGREPKGANIETGNLSLYASGSIYGAYDTGYLTTQITTLDAHAGVLIKIWDLGIIGQALNVSNAVIGGIDESVDLVATYDMNVGYVSDPTDVKLTSINGAIIDDNGDDPNILTGNLTLSASTGIGSDDALETQVTNLQATNTNNYIKIKNTGSLTLTNISDGSSYAVSNTNGSVDITAADIIVNDDITGGALVSLNADNSISVTDSLVSATAASGTASINMISGIGGISLTRSHVEASVEEGDATVTLNAGGAITIEDSLVPACVMALVDGNGNASIDMDAGADGISITDDLILADVDGIGNASVNLTSDGNIILDNSDIKAEVEIDFSEDDTELYEAQIIASVNLDAEQGIQIVDSSTIEAEVEFSTSYDIYLTDSEIESSVYMEADDNITLDDSQVAAYTDLEAEDIELYGTDVEADVEIYGEEDCIHIENSDVRAEVNLDSEDTLTIEDSYDTEEASLIEANIELSTLWDGWDIEITDSEIESSVYMEADDNITLDDSQVAAYTDLEAEDIELYGTDVEADVEIYGEEDCIHIENSDVRAEVNLDSEDTLTIEDSYDTEEASLIEANIELSTLWDGWDIEITDSEIESSVYMEADDNIILDDSQVAAYADLEAEDIELYGTDVEADVEIYGEEDCIHIENSDVRAEVNLDSEDTLTIEDSYDTEEASLIEANIELSTLWDGWDIEITDSEIEASVYMEADDNITLDDSQVAAYTDLEAEDIELYGTDVEADVEIYGEEDCIHIENSDVRAEVNLDSEDTLTIEDSYDTEEASLIEANIELSTLWDGWDIEITDSEIEASVYMEADDNIILDDSQVAAYADLEAEDIELYGTDVEADVEIYGEEDCIHIENSDVRAEVNLDSEDTLTIEDSYDTEEASLIEANIELSTLWDGWDIEITDSEIESSVYMEADDNIILDDSQVAAYADLEAEDIELYGTDVEADVEIYGEEDCIHIENSDVRAEVNLDSEDTLTIEDSYDTEEASLIEANIELSTLWDGWDIEITDSEIESSVYMEADDNITLDDSQVAAYTDLEAEDIELYGTDVEADVEIYGEEDCIHIENSDVRAEVNLDSEDTLTIDSEGEISVLVNLDADEDVEVDDSDVDAEVDMEADGDILIGGTITSAITGIGGVTAEVELTAGGSISDTLGSGTIATDTLTLIAGNGIGEDANYLNTDVVNLIATTTAGDIYIEEVDGVNIKLTAAGGVNLITLGGSVLPYGDGTHLTAGADSLLQARGIALLGTPLDVALSAGDLTVDISDEILGVSGIFTGTGTLVVNTTTPGIVYFNGVQIYPPIGTDTGLISQESYLLFWRLVLPTLENLALYSDPFNPGGPVSFYHPLTDVDWSAFDQFVLEEGAYEFIEDSLNIIGHEGLKPLLDEIKRRSGK